MPGTVSYLNHEPVWVLAGADIDNLAILGFIEEGDVTVTIASEWVDHLTHQTGISVIQKYFKGSTVMAEAVLSEIGNLDMWEIAFPTAEEQMDTSTPPLNRMAGNKAVATTPYIGQKGTALDTMVCLRPARLYVDAATATAGDFIIPQAVCQSPGVLTMGIDTAMALPVEFHGIFNTAATEGENLWYYGITEGTWVVVS